MGRYVIESQESKSIKKLLKKWGEIPIHSEYMDGVIKIKNYRKYPLYNQVDVVFEGKVFVKLYREPRSWRDSSILKTHRISIVKLNRLLRKCSLFDIQTRMRYFGVDIRDYYNITKIKWE